MHCSQLYEAGNKQLVFFFVVFHMVYARRAGKTQGANGRGGQPVKATS
jgi:prolipoprotein diacylglyceryltransferase